MSIDALAPIAPQYRAAGPTKLFIKEKKMSLSGDSARIKDEHGNTIFTIDAHLMTISDRRTLADSQGNVIGQLRRKKTPGIHETYYIGTPTDDKKCAVKLKGILNPIKCDAHIMVGGTNVGEVSGNWRAKKFSIYVKGYLVAQVHRKTSLGAILMDADTYCIQVEPGVDLAFISLVTIALDELYHDED